MRTAILPTSPNLFLEPLDLHWGLAASRMMQWHNGLPLLGGAAAAATVAVWRPGHPQLRLEIPASGITAWLEALPEAERAYADAIIDAWRRPCLRHAWCGPACRSVRPRGDDEINKKVDAATPRVPRKPRLAAHLHGQCRRDVAAGDGRCGHHRRPSPAVTGRPMPAGSER